VKYVMCWHGLPAYWGGIMPGAPALDDVTGGRIVYPKPTEGIAEIEPSLMWSPAVLAGGRARGGFFSGGDPWRGARSQQQGSQGHRAGCLPAAIPGGAHDLQLFLGLLS
jgi:hypothetical protein